jgi:dimethylaniline monooxygenase (N-oxide forming)
LQLPFLSADLVRALGVDARPIDLHKHTFHPDLPGLAFVGLRQMMGPNFPVVELQGRWISYAWSGTRPAPSREEMQAGVASCRAERGAAGDLPMHVAALLFATEAGVEPQVERWPELTRALMFGPLSPVSFRLSGPDSLRDAPRETRLAAAAFGAVPTPDLTPGDCLQLKALAAARNDPAFLRFVEQVTAPAVTA